MRGAPAAPVAAALILALSRAGSATPVDWRLEGILDLRLVESDSDHVWLDAGLDKARFDDDAAAELGAALLEVGTRFAPTLSSHVTLAAYDGLDTAIDVTEAYLEFLPVPRSAWRFRGRAGAFYPPGTLENRSAAWTTPYTLSFSAIDSWYAEELRIVGLEGGIERMGRMSGSPNDFSFSAGAFRWNDPAGAILSWRGWALHDRQTGIFERLPLAPLPSFVEGGDLYEVQGAFDQPVAEIDGRTGWYAAAEWRWLDRSAVSAIHYDNRGDPGAVEGGQWAWLTRFDRIGWLFKPTSSVDVVAQALVGSTRIDGYEGPLVDNDFDAWSLLVSFGRGPHRGSVRYDRFSVDDRDTNPSDPNDEEGDAWTGAWFYAPPASWSGWLPAGALRLVGEILVVDSRRPAREIFGDAARESESQLQVAVQWRFPE